MSGKKSLILGGAQIGQPYGRFNASLFSNGGNLSNLFGIASEVGFEAVDTARTYGRSEVMIAREGWSGEIHTKLDESISPWKSLEKSLECLEREAVSLLYVCHDATRISDPSKNFWGPVFEDLKPFSKSFGLALYADQLCFDMISFDEISVVQAPFNILSSCELENRLGEIRQAGKRIYVRSIYSQGALLVPPARISNSEVREAVGAFHLASLEIGVSRDELAFRWAYFHPFVDGLVLGVSSLSEINRVGAWIAAGPLSADELSYTERALDNNRIDIDLRSQQ